ncbi:MAG: beta-phosphoglucomutase [Clostridiales bacterium]|nr:beta-phosphoglucomutase [Clostridiales bacterium]
MKYKAVIFDLDGVICYTDRYHYLAWKQIADREGIYFDERINDRLRGVSRMQSLEIILEKADRAYSEEEKRALAEEKNQAYREFLVQMTPGDLPEEVKKVLHTLKKAKIRMAIGSSSKNTKLILKQIGLENFFDAVSDGTNITHSKPDPEVFVKAAAMLNLPPKDCVVVEDAGAGIEAAYRGGFASVGIGEAARAPKVTYPLSSVGGLPAILFQE